VRSGSVVKIVPEASVRTMPGDPMPQNLSGGADDVVTTVLEVKNVNANQVATVLRQFVGQAGLLTPVPGTNTMIITDRASNVRRIQNILTRVDQSSNASFEAIPLENSTAADVVRTLKALTTGTPADAAAGAQAPLIVADDRTNSVLIGGEPQQRLRIVALIASLDTPISNGGGTQVRYLRNADAEKLAPKLKELATGVAAIAAGGAAATTTAAADRSVSIIADEYSNALIITAPPKTMRSLMSTIDQLDIALAQVNITAIVADVSDTQAADIGVNWTVFSTEDGTSVPAGGFISPVGTANGNKVSIVDLANAINNPAAATSVPLGATVAIGRLRDNGLNILAMARALRADGNTNVILESSVTAMDNQEAQLKNAQEVPFITGQYTNTGGNNNGNVNPFTTVQRQEVGTILTVTPQINGGDQMILTINLESSELAGTAGDAGSLITNKRTVKTSVRVGTGETIVLGGLIRDSKVTGETRVPGLGRIPLIGELFRTRSGKREKSNLMVFIRPTIMLDGVQTSRETNAKYNAVRELQQMQNNHKEILPLLPFDAPPLLPEIAPAARPVTPTAPVTTNPVPATP
jgi:general secretion pathway protein D